MSSQGLTERCRECGDEFRQRRPWQKFCGKKCRWSNWNRNHPRVALGKASPENPSS